MSLFLNRGGTALQGTFGILWEQFLVVRMISGQEQQCKDSLTLQRTVPHSVWLISIPLGVHVDKTLAHD